MSAKKIQSTKNYRLFERHTSENRPVDLKKHRALVESMKRYGFLHSFPIVVNRSKTGALVVKDGQHRLMIAEMLGLPVHYVEDDKDFDVAIVNSSAKVWILRDYAQKFAANGIEDYAEGIQFAEKHSISIGTACALLSGTTTFSNVDEAFRSGEWRVKDRQWADAVAGIYTPLVRCNPQMKNARLIEACMAACRVKLFNPARLVANAERCREKLIAYSTRDGYLDMLEAVYNFGRKELLGLKAAAQMEMKKRNAVHAAAEKKQQKVAAVKSA